LQKVFHQQNVNLSFINFVFVFVSFEDDAMNFLIEKILEVAKKNRPKTTEPTVVTIESQTSSNSKSEKMQFNRCCG
jgi:hypothetical protein